MVVSIYTGRVVLEVLGVDDFGIYNIVGGVVVMFSFIKTFLDTACGRFISVAIVGEDKDKPGEIFRTAMFLHFLIAVLFVIIAETIGLWFVYNKLVIPENRFQAAVWLYHIFVFNSCFTIMKVPYNAVIIAEERMDFYAYTSIAESVFRLLIVYLLLIISGFDKLILYGLLHTGTSVIMFLWYHIYTCRRFYYCEFSFRYKKSYLKEMTGFSGWNLFGSIADLGYKQGTNIILNMFYGVALNAAMGLATTVRSTIYNFINNFQTASNPQIIKTYSLGEYSQFRVLVNRVSKLSYFLMLLLTVPAIINMKYILNLWLVKVPEYTTSFVILGLIFCLIDCLHGPLWTSIIATGKIRVYQLTTSLILLLNLPLSYMALYHGFCPESILIIQIAVSFITLFVRLFFSVKCAHILFHVYIKDVIVPVLIVTIIVCPLSYFVAILFEQSFVKLLVTGLFSVVIVAISSYVFGLTVDERKFIKEFVVKKILRRS